MSKTLLKALLATPALAGMILGSAAFAETPVTTQVSSLDNLDQLNQYGLEGSGRSQVDQVTSVSQLSDVSPTDWAFQALQSLVERYGCIAGYPDGTYRGNRAMTRYEFAVSLNSCLNQIADLVTNNSVD